MKEKSAILLLLMILLGLIVNLYNPTKDSHTTMSEATTVKTAYLTFDDGPSNITPEILDILNKNNIKATFFLIGNAITSENEDLIKSMAESGHTIGIHTYSHKCKEIYGSIDAYVEDFNLAFEKLYEITGTKPTIFRFPGGSINDFSKGNYKKIIAKMEEMGFVYYDWNVSAEDSVGKPTQTSILKNIRKFKNFDEPVILMHDSSINAMSAKLLPQIINEIKEAGYTFDTLEHRKPCQFGRY